MIPMIDEYNRIISQNRKPTVFKKNKYWTAHTKDVFNHSSDNYLKKIASKYGIEKNDYSNKMRKPISFENALDLKKQNQYVLDRFPKYVIKNSKEQHIGVNVYSRLVNEIFSFIHTPVTKKDLKKIIKNCSKNTMLYLNYYQSNRGQLLDDILQKKLVN